ncbi:MAG: cell division protein FtsA [Elusimicrobiales bacterium]|nr:cell division protein FtsA [Elusimicrobiales bacterium]
MEENILSLDFGSDSIVCAVGKVLPDNTIELIGATYLECKKGLKSGVVTSILSATNTIKKILDEIEQKHPGIKLDSAYVGIRGSHIMSVNNHGIYTITRSDKEITEQDIINVIENARAIHLQNERVIIHTIPQDFSVDKETGFSNPVGMEGNIIETDVHLITANVSHLNNISKCVANAGLKLNEHIYHAYPLAEIVISEEEKKLGSVLIDIGDLTTSIVIYHDGTIKYSKDISIGSFLITNDIAYAYHTSFETAQNIKENHGYSLSGLIKENKEFDIVLLDRTTKKKITEENLCEYIKPRLEEIFLYIREEIVNSGYEDRINSIVLTGGGSMLRGIDKACEKIFKGKEVRHGLIPDNYVKIKDKKYYHQKYTTAIALLCYPIYIKPQLDVFMVESETGFISQIIKWFKNLFS